MSRRRRLPMRGHRARTSRPRRVCCGAFAVVAALAPLVAPVLIVAIAGVPPASAAPNRSSADSARAPVASAVTSALPAALDDAPTVQQISADRWVIPLSSMGLGSTIRLSGQVADRSVALTVPLGFRPIEVDASLAVSPDIAGGFLEAQPAGGDSVAVDVDPLTASKGTQAVVLPVAGAQVVEQRTGLALSSRLRSADDLCTTAVVGGWLELRDAVLVVEGSPTPPTSVGQFLPPLLQSLDVVVPPDPTAGEAAAAMLVVASAQHEVGSRPLAVTVRGAPARGQVVDAPFSPIAASVVIDGTAPTGGAIVARPAGGSVLVIGGDDQQLGLVAQALGNDLIPLAVGGTATVETLAPVPVDTNAVRPFDELGLNGLSGSGVSRIDLQTSLSQSTLGGPVQGVRLHVLGTHTPVVGNAQATFSVRVNDVLIKAQDLGNDDQLDVSVAIPADQVTRDMRLTFRAEYTPPDGLCRPGVFPFTIQIFSGTSTVEQVAGQGLPPGFERFPQAQVPGFDMGFDVLATDRLDMGAQLVASLQRMTGARLEPVVVPLADALASDGTAIVVGEDAGAIHDARPPLTQGPVDARRDDATLLRLETDQPFAALQAYGGTSAAKGVVTPPDRVLLSWRDDPELARTLARNVNGVDFSWASLRGDTYFQSRGAPALNVSLRGPELQPAEPQGSSSLLSRAVPIAELGTVLFLLLLVAWGLRALLRRRRLKRSPRPAAEAVVRSGGAGESEPQSDRDRPDEP